MDLKPGYLETPSEQMRRPALKILLASSEVAPFAKTGGLADVCAALPVALEALGHEVTVVMPAFRSALQCHRQIRKTDLQLSIPIKSQTLHARVLRSSLPDSNVTLLLVDYPPYFDRQDLYRDELQDYPDNCERFTFFSRAVLQILSQLPDSIDIVHCNDWQTGLIPAFLKLELNSDSRFQSLASLFTIHNLAYQGLFSQHDMPVTGLDWQFFNWRQMEYYGKLNLLKTGIVFADGLNTVSPTYALEIQTPELGCGLDGLLRERGQVLQGILNGIDQRVWNPKTDPHLFCNYDSGNWEDGKAQGKAALQKAVGLPRAPRTLMIGIIGRLTTQKGWDILTPVIEHWARTQEVQWVILGTGDPHFQRKLEDLGRNHPQKVAVRLEFSEASAHQIEAGSDLFLMPSHYEPCGLNQLYSLRYGTVPLVRQTGGLADTVVNATAETLATERANGFSFRAATTAALEETLDRASQIYQHQPDTWRQLVETGMAQDWSWERSASAYERLYKKLLSKQRHDSRIPTE